ncbi:hypothetical protein KDA_75700 [Dictyobacter alpinus]|uniref:Uncharacterized protein n=1 Tax=Dictyobacter alpinus TaxID=2014873 RepID=A0A402BL84_9CHLR|nr:hypothetical protein [Dictyobacter alpinus]GCE32086.1 hypothetical protein KDA_75700 [Dictyobacter alpinus]
MMSHEQHPLAYIGGLVLVLFIGYILLSTGMDMGMVIVVIIALVAAGIGGNMLLQRYKRVGKEHFFNSMVSNIDPTLPPPFPEMADELTQAAVPYHMQEPYSDEEENLFGGRIPRTHPGFYSGKQQGHITTITEHPQQELSGPDVRGALTAGASQPPQQQHALPESHEYELQIGDHAYVDVTQAYVNALLLDPSGNIPRVLAEELALKGVAQLFIDVSGDYTSLLNEFPYGYHVISPEAYQQQESGANTQTVALSQSQETQAIDFGHTLMQYGWQVLFDFASYTSPTEASIVLWGIIDGMAGWERKQYKQSNRYLPAVITLTDAYRLCPDDDRHSIHKDKPGLAQSVRKAILNHLQKRGQWGLHWYLVTRRVTGMDPEALQQCILWIVEHPAAAEVKTGWLSAYMGIAPQEIERVPAGQALILDRTNRVPQYIRFRHSHSEPNRQTDALTNTFSLPAITRQSGENASLPFQQR